MPVEKRVGPVPLKKFFNAVAPGQKCLGAWGSYHFLINPAPTPLRELMLVLANGQTRARGMSPHLPGNDEEL